MTSSSEIDALNKKFDELSNEVNTLKSEISQQSKMRSLEWAVTNVHKVGGFDYKCKRGNNSKTFQSPEFVQGVLILFRKGQGARLDNNLYVSEITHDQMMKPTDDEKAAFRRCLSEHIFQLTGQQPRVELKAPEEGMSAQYTINYS
mmetsp:Transcript_25490/g.30018  ORF Transcript_25490/g.30018 Transcript_25490/m.30018 type:complete len:146 (-) Transcript_25490:119-556(-)